MGTDEVFKFIKDIIYNPYLEDGAFPKKEIEDIKSWMSSPSLNENSLVELEKKLNKYSTVIGEK